VSLGGCSNKAKFAKLTGKFDGEFIYLRVVDNPNISIYKYKPEIQKDAYGSSFVLTWLGTIWMEDGVPKLTPPAWVEFGKFGTWDYGRYRDSHERTHYVSESYMNEPGTASDLVKSMKSDYDYAVEYQAKETADWASEAAKIKASNAQAAREIDADMANFMRNKTTEWNRAADTLNNTVANGNSNSHHSRDDAAQLNKNERDKTDDIYPDKKANTPLARRDSGLCAERGMRRSLAPSYTDPAGYGGHCKETNPYEAGNGWKYAVDTNSTYASARPLDSRSSACNEAQQLLKVWESSIDRGVVVTQRSPCVCRTGDVEFKNTSNPNGWVCGIYVQTNK
jgi:hypothetical protein